MYSPLWKITHQNPSVLCTPPFETSPIKAHRFHVLPPPFGKSLFLVGAYFGKYGNRSVGWLMGRATASAKWLEVNVLMGLLCTYREISEDTLIQQRGNGVEYSDVDPIADEEHPKVPIFKENLYPIGVRRSGGLVEHRGLGWTRRITRGVLKDWRTKRGKKKTRNCALQREQPWPSKITY